MASLRRQPDLPTDAQVRLTGMLFSPMIRDIGLAWRWETRLSMSWQPTSAKLLPTRTVGGMTPEGGTSTRRRHVGVLPPTAPLPTASATMTGLAFAGMRQHRSISCCMHWGGASSSGEFWEAMNFAGARGLPITHILQNNQIALDTPPAKQSGVELWADKAAAMGFPAWTIDGSDPAWHASTAVAREFSMAGGGPTLIHVETMRGCGHAHHHDDLYLGNPSETPPGYVIETFAYWEAKFCLRIGCCSKSWVLRMNCLRPWKPRKGSRGASPPAIA